MLPGEFVSEQLRVVRCGQFSPTASRGISAPRAMVALR
jgi:hypothetical protein